jgi:hypothetical protein
MTKLSENNPQGTANIADDRVLGNVLYLTLKKKWFDMIASGEKREEYREIKEYWLKRLFRHNDYAILDQQMLDEVIYEINNKPYTTNELYDLAGWSPKRFNFVCFRKGYAKDAPEIWCRCEGIEIKQAKSEWSDNAKGYFFTIELGKILDAPVMLS